MHAFIFSISRRHTRWARDWSSDVCSTDLNNKSIIVPINDRGPFHSSRIIDLSYAAAAKLDMVGPGKATVRVEAITHEDIRTGRYQTPTDTQLAHDSANEPKPKAQPAVYTMEKDPLSEFLAQREKQRSEE